VVFPGQGAQSASMLDSVARLPQYSARHEVVCEALGENLEARLADGDPDYLRRNLPTSLATVLASVVAYERYVDECGPPSCLGGYSVGQWTALYAAATLDFRTLVEVVTRRAKLMDACLENQNTGMLAVIGLPLRPLEALCAEFAGRGLYLRPSTINCPGQYSLSGTLEAIEQALAELAPLHPKRLLRLPLQGAWHCDLLAPAARAFAEYLDTLTLAMPNVPMVDNVTGTWLDAAALRATLATHLHRPVLWERCVRTLLEDGCTEVVEVGPGELLTRFGFFLDRKVRFRCYRPGVP